MMSLLQVSTQVRASVLMLVLSSSFLVSNDNAFVNAAEISDQCRNETIPLLTEPNLEIAQQIIFEDYEASYNDVCDIGLDKQECDIRFEGDERTYRALCEQGNNGQLYQRPVKLSCAFGFEYDLGFIPTCVASSCNISNVEPGDVVTDQVDQFLDNLTFVGCRADASGASATTFGFWSSSAALFIFAMINFLLA